MSRTLETLQQRVNALEKNLAPFTVPYPPMSSYACQMNSVPITNGKCSVKIILVFLWLLKKNEIIYLGFQYSPSPLPNANGFEPPPTRMVNGWTVDDQINKSKMWLKQRNQQMMSRK